MVPSSALFGPAAPGLRSDANDCSSRMARTSECCASSYSTMNAKTATMYVSVPLAEVAARSSRLGDEDISRLC